MNLNSFSEIGYNIPKYSVDNVRECTKNKPDWIHFGSGNLFRSLLCNVNQENLDQSLTTKGIIAVSGRNTKKHRRTYKMNNNLCVYLQLNHDGTIDKNILANICDTIELARDSNDFNTLKSYFESDNQIWLTFTITEKGYNLRDSEGKYLDDVLLDFEKGPTTSSSYFGMICSLLLHRYYSGQLPTVLTSFDNLKSNGQVLKNIFEEYAKTWIRNGYVEKGFLDYLNNIERVTFPWTMTDKITPSVFEESLEIIHNDCYKNQQIFSSYFTSLDSAVVNAEKSQYLIIEDSFPITRPSLQGNGVLYTTRDEVSNYELIKVTAALNPIHSTLAVFGSLFEIPTIYDCLRNPLLKLLVTNMGYKESILSLDCSLQHKGKEFLTEVLEERFSNPFIKDTPSRIMTDTSMKVAVRYGETLKRAYLRGDNMKNYVCHMLSIAGWLRYHQGVSDLGAKIQVSSDPRFDQLISNYSEKSLNSDYIKLILEDKDLFGVDLHLIGVANTVQEMINSMSCGIGNVKSTIEKYLKEVISE